MSKKIVLILMLSLSLFAYDATVEIVKKIDSLPRIAIQDASDTGVNLNLRKKFYKILLGDLRVSANFKPLDEYLQSSYDGGVGENFLSKKNVDLILRFKLETDGKSLLAHVKLITASTGDVKNETNYKLPNLNRFPFLAHRIIVNVNDLIGAPSIKWMEQFVIFSKLIGKKESEIVVSDYTLSFQRVVVKGGLNLFPQWANATQDQFYYSSYNGYRPTLYKVDLSNGQRTKILSSNGMLVCSDVSKDGRKLLLTMAPNDQTDIYLYNVVDKQLRRITKYPGIDVSGKFIDNDKRMVFISDRLGYPNIFAKDLNGDTSVEQMVYHGKNNSSVSANGNYIVYSSRENSSEFGRNVFNLYLISTNTDYIRQLTANGKNLYPRFAEDEDTILFIKEYKNQSSLGIIRLSANKSFLFPLKVGKIQSIDW
ncbi:MAG: Tol-Pal system protein TolB [Sulfurospirillaceae bacterium]|nr:Tol-Pal system protein TolB [Sulfurospirillaceae bacterium]